MINVCHHQCGVKDCTVVRTEVVQVIDINVTHNCDDCSEAVKLPMVIKKSAFMKQNLMSLCLIYLLSNSFCQCIGIRWVDEGIEM